MSQSGGNPRYYANIIRKISEHYDAIASSILNLENQQKASYKPIFMAEFENNFKEPQATHHFKRTNAQTIQKRNNKEGTMYKNINAAINEAIKKVREEKQKKI